MFHCLLACVAFYHLLLFYICRPYSVDCLLSPPPPSVHLCTPFSTTSHSCSGSEQRSRHGRAVGPVPRYLTDNSPKYPWDSPPSSWPCSPPHPPPSLGIPQVHDRHPDRPPPSHPVQVHQVAQSIRYPTGGPLPTRTLTINQLLPAYQGLA